ncbi:protein of unknown function [Streptomyces sp. DvalAA-14]|uniref:DUF5133 domain-containing protein n=1 Tax=unclassified Streptomyces TaxID=2593676 RepID=UPI00081B742A|nr:MULTISPECIES: DUF5133 domain-containing protein [unclassified Streptomyces]MYS19519.1 DUF5133 domain-containing protein [Streptomyces sp. SID4948]SCD46257.1 protein of unknown function [Streptomyces sp. DvalAA-14]
MIWAHPSTLQTLVDRYEQLRQRELAGQPDPQLQARLRDTAYTLCVSTGTRHVGLALAVARKRVAQSRTETAVGLTETGVQASGDAQVRSAGTRATV